MSQVRSQQHLPANANGSVEIRLKRTAELLSISENELWRYFWGIRRNKQGKPLAKKGKQVIEMEADLIIKFRACSKLNAATQSSIGSVEAIKELTPSKVATTPLHTSKTQSGLAAIYDFVDDTATGTGTPEWQNVNRAEPG